MLKFAIFDPRPISVAKEANEKIFLGKVRGVEVTIPELANRCLYGNVDPQHSGGDSGRSAIEEALNEVNDYELYDNGRPCCGMGWDSYGCPKCDGADQPPFRPDVLVTIRPDLDSIGYMAVYAMRAKGIELGPAMDRIRFIAESDKFAKGGWPGARPLPTAERPFDDDSTASAESDSRLAPMSAVVSDFKLPVSERVELLIKWLLTGEEPSGYRERWTAERIALAKAIADGAIKAEVVAGGKVAKVISTHRAATSVGYCLAPIVVALNPRFQLGGGEPHKKFTICQFIHGHIDLKAILAELSGLETGWGGSPTIGGSPQGVSSRLTLDGVVSVVEKHLLK